MFNPPDVPKAIVDNVVVVHVVGMTGNTDAKSSVVLTFLADDAYFAGFQSDRRLTLASLRQSTQAEVRRCNAPVGVTQKCVRATLPSLPPVS